MNYEHFGSQVRLARHQKGMTQEELAEQVGISTSFLGHIERGSRVASLETLVSLCNTLNVSPDHLLYASLNVHQGEKPLDLTDDQRDRLRDFLRLATDAVNSW